LAKLLDIVTVEVPRSLLDDTYAFMREAGRGGRESIVLWAGQFVEAPLFQVTTILRPAQTTYRGDHGLLAAVSGEELFRINRTLSDGGLRLLAQLHSHPTDAYHSDTDDRYAIVTARGSFSIVVPDFAAGTPAIESCAVFRLAEPGLWREVPSSAISTFFQVAEDA
jgi:hypothetical protein